MPNIKTGKADVEMDLPSHVPGTKQGNSKGNYEKQSGHEPDGRRTARSSTGIDPDASEPIDPSMPNLSPA